MVVLLLKVMRMNVFISGIILRIMDQRLALEWVYANIEHFGGNKNEITLTGHSAGAMACAVHMVSPLTKPHLFNKVFMMGNPFAIQYRVAKEDEIYSKMFSLLLGCSRNDRACYERKTVANIIDAQKDVVMIPHPPLLSTRNGLLPWKPLVDGVDLPGQPLRLFREGKVKNVTVVLGVTREESVSFIMEAVPIELPSWLYQVAFAGWLTFNYFEAMKIYPPIHRDGRYSTAIAAGDYFWYCGNKAAASALTKSGIPSYLYVMNHSPKIDPANGLEICRGNSSCHGAELSFFYHSYPHFNVRRDREESEMAVTMMRYMTQFVHGVNRFVKYDDSTNDIVSFGLKTEVTRKYKTRECEFWEKIGEYYK
jgi:carboxylesterase type B